MEKHNKTEIAEQLIKIVEDSDINLDFVEALSRDPLHVSIKLKVQIDRVCKRLGKDFFPKVIWTITQKSYSASEANMLWEGTVRHKKKLDQ